jgi:purine-binding chemotaxis protein CheW
MASEHQFCTFFVEGSLFGIPVAEVQEVLRFQEMIAVPLAPAGVEGMLNLRGQIVIAIDLRRRLGLAERPADDRPMNVVLRTEDGAVSLLVDKIGDVIEVEQSSFETAPQTMLGSVRAMVLGVHKLDGRLLHLLDTGKACELGEAGAGRADESIS